MYYVGGIIGGPSLWTRSVIDAKGTLLGIVLALLGIVYFRK